MSDVRKLVYAIVKFLKAQLIEGGLSGECAEGVEVGIQCLEAAYNIGATEPSLSVPNGLREIFNKYLTDYVSTLRLNPFPVHRSALRPEAAHSGSFQLNLVAFFNRQATPLLWMDI